MRTNTEITRAKRIVAKDIEGHRKAFDQASFLLASTMLSVLDWVTGEDNAFGNIILAPGEDVHDIIENNDALKTQDNAEVAN